MSAMTRSTLAIGRPLVKSGRPGLAALALAVLLLTPPPAARADGGAAGATAQNVSITIQLLWQVQQGCALRCVQTSQTQTAVQTATTIQIAAATDPDAAVAVNTSAVIQLVVQTQLGCVAFCIGTTRVQSASQRA